MGAASKRAKKVRSASEFDLARLQTQLRQPVDGRGVVGEWTLERIFAARSAQMRGHFSDAARAAEQMRTDDALYTAYENRLAPQRCLKKQIAPASGARGASIAAEGDALFGGQGVALHPDTLADIHGDLANHGVAFATIKWTTREDGSRVDPELNYFPIEFVRFDQILKDYVARIDPSSEAAANFLPQPAEETPYRAASVPAYFSSVEVPIQHGDGRWVVFKKHEVDSHRKEAAILPGLIVWARHAYACRDWAKGSTSHGSAKMVGELPSGVPLQDEGGLTAEASAFLSLLQALASADTPAGIRPSGAKTEFVTNTSNAWQVWSELVLNAEKAAARIYLGTDGTLGSQGGAPGVDITKLFGVATTIVRGDLECIQRGINTGLIQPWCAINFGDSTLAPSLEYVIPNDEQDEAHESYVKRVEAFHEDVKRHRDNGFQIDQSMIDRLAESHGVAAPLLPQESEKAPTIALAPTDIARVVSVNEARASAGLGPLMKDGAIDPDGNLTVEEFSEKKKMANVLPAPAVAPAPDAAQLPPANAPAALKRLR